MEQGTSKQNLKGSSCATVLTLAYQSLGVVYGDLSTSPLYVYKTTFSGKLSLKEDDVEIFGVLSFVFWTFTIIALLKYVFIVMSADDNGEGGTFALYSLLCRNARLSILPNQESADETQSAYATEDSADTWQSSLLKSFFEKNLWLQKGLLIFVLLGTCMTISDGVLTPAISDYVIMISCVILVGIFSIQHHGTHRVAFLFAPFIAAWLLCISVIGVYNIFHWNPKIYYALSPVYMFRFIKTTGIEGWLSLGGVVLSITGAEMMFADMGHFSALSIKIAFTCLVYPCLILAYIGEAAFLSKNHFDVQRKTVFWPVFIVATLVSVVASQAAISATFSIISQCRALNCFPSVKIIHTSSRLYGQIYIPEVNWILMCLCLAVTIGLRDTNRIGHAYGLAVTTVMFVTTCLMALVIVIVWKQGIIVAITCLLFFGSIELFYVSSCIYKVTEGAWISLVLSFVVMCIMYTWNYGTSKKYEFDVENKIPTDHLLCMGPSLGMVRVPGVGLIYTNVASGFPAFFGHLVTNLPAFHEVLVFVCVKSVQVPYVSEKQRLVISRIGPREYSMFRCIVRYGYKDILLEKYNFENKMVSSIIQFIETGDEIITKK
ncbi:putative potassium transporter [Lupinus albus]|uniref:Potassium transporter n=1 Tax=Lupinus albus TaxID=3870 RepID=A0A6A4PDD8_LUPAL|nr:putative potassium transporter [Lupinus albus]